MSRRESGPPSGGEPPSHRLHELLDAVTSGTEVIVAAQDAELRYTFFNRAYQEEIKRLTGKELELGMSMAELFADFPAEQAVAVREWTRVLHGETTAQILEFGPPGLYRRIYSARKTPIRNSAGQVVGAGEVAFDVTEQKRAEERLRVVTRLYAVLSLVNEAIVRTRDEQTLCQEVCRLLAEQAALPLAWIGLVQGQQVVPSAWCGPGAAYLQRIQVEVDGALGSGPTGTCVRENHPVVNGDFSTNPSVSPWRELALEHGFRGSAAFPLHRAGKVIGALTLYAPVPDAFDSEHLRLLAALAADVSYALAALERERLRAQTADALRASEARLKLLSTTSALLLATDSPQGIVTQLCRDVMEHLDCQVFFNFLADDSLGRLRLNAYAGIEDQEAARIEWLDYGVAICGCAARDSLRINAEDIQHTTDPRAALVRSYGVQAYCCHPLQAQGRTIGTLSFGTKTRPRFSEDDVALMKTVADQVAVAMERVRAEEALRAANAELMDNDRRKNDFLAVLSHELRNPLSPIANSVYVLDHAAPGSDQARRAQAVIGRQVGQLARLVDDLLDVTRITRNKIELQRHRLELNELVQRVTEDHRSLFDRNEVSLELRLGHEPSIVDGDANRLAQVIGNLLSNAAKFTGPGGAARVSVSTDLAAKRAIVRVADTGIGVAPDMISRLFDPFVQAEPKLDRSKGGLGLGLTLARGLVLLHGGELSVRSEGLGQGTEFAVRLPLAVESTVRRSDAEQGQPRSGRRVLIIEDNTDAADSLRIVLELAGHEVAVAYDGRDGLDLARELRPEVVLCDLGLPGMDGFEIARAFRADELLRETFLVALSGYAQPEDKQRAAAAGFERHLAKPPSLPQIEQLLAEARRPAH
jgi:signal transduction histidine kinase/ActR/RegA family two-component response regulator